MGQDPKGERAAEKIAQRLALFRKGIEDCVQATHDDAAQAVLQFLNALSEGSDVLDLPGDCATNDLLAFAYGMEEALVHERNSIKAYWKQYRAELAEDREGGEGICLVSGSSGSTAAKTPQLKNVPGGSTSGVALISFNASAFESYGWKKSKNASISEEAGIASMTALNRLLHPNPPDPRDPNRTLPRRNTRLSADTVVCYWTRDEVDEFADGFGMLMEVDEQKAQARPAQVAAMYDCIWKGNPYSLEKPTAFYSLVLSGGQGRATLRDWIESNTQTVADSLARYFADLAIVRRCPPTKKLGRHLPSFPLRLLLESVADPCERRSEGVPAPLASALYRAAIDQAYPFPRMAYSRAVSRYRAEIAKERSGSDGWKTADWNDARAALIKGFLERSRRNGSITLNEEVKVAMNPNCKQPGYVLGQLMAVLERLQEAAANRRINATVVDRYFSGASASPKSVFTGLLRNARHHARKARDDRKNAGLVFRLERVIDELSDQFVVGDSAGAAPGTSQTDAFPASLDQDQQGLFVLGYHQMRKWLWMNQEERNEWEVRNLEAPRAFLWNRQTREDQQATT